jgi:RNA polymerase sigma-70 factor, ECF subfamily
MDETAVTNNEFLIRAAQGGDPSAFARLVETHYAQIYRFAYRWSAQASDAEDITQLACIKLAHNLGQFRFESAFSSWLYRLVINCAKDWHKSQKRHIGQQLAPEELAEPCTSQQTAEMPIYLAQVLGLLNQLAEGFKETALLVYAEGLTHAEAAQILELKESTVSWRLHEIRKQLKQLQLTQGDNWEAQL